MKRARAIVGIAIVLACGAPAQKPTTITVEPLPTPQATATMSGTITMPQTPPANAAPEVLVPGRVTIVHFFASWCLPCAKEMPALDALAAKLSARVAIIAFGEDDDVSDMHAFAQKLGVHFNVIWDGDKTKATLWHPSSMPTTFIVDRHGALRFTHAGFHDDDGAEIEKEARLLLDEP